MCGSQVQYQLCHPIRLPKASHIRILVPEIPLAQSLPNISAYNEEYYARWKETLIPQPGYLTDAQPLHIMELFKLS